MYFQWGNDACSFVFLFFNIRVVNAMKRKMLFSSGISVDSDRNLLKWICSISRSIIASNLINSLFAPEWFHNESPAARPNFAWRESCYWNRNYCLHCGAHGFDNEAKKRWCYGTMQAKHPQTKQKIEFADISVFFFRFSFLFKSFIALHRVQQLEWKISPCAVCTRHRWCGVDFMQYHASETSGAHVVTHR